MTLINGASLQDNCKKEGFNVKCSRSGLKSRIGFFGNNENDCISCDSVIGFGIEMRDWKWSSGNVYYNMYNENIDVRLKTFGYIFVQ